MKKIKILMVMLTIMSMVLNSNVRLAYSTNLLPPTSTNPNWMTMDIGYGVKYDGPRVIHGKGGDVELVAIKIREKNTSITHNQYEVVYTAKANNVKKWFEGKPFVTFKLCGYDIDGFLTKSWDHRIIKTDSLVLSENFFVPMDTVKIVLEEDNI